MYSIIKITLLTLLFSNYNVSDRHLMIASNASLSFENIDFDQETVDIYIDSDLPVAGFQIWFEGMSAIGASGGLVDDENFNISINEDMILGFSLEGNTISSGYNHLTTLSFSNINQDNQICFASANISNSNANPLTVNYGE